MEDYEDILPKVKDGEILIQGFFDGLRPVARLTVSEWANKYRFLSTVAASEAGQYRTDRTPYLRQIMDCLSSYESYSKIVVIKGAQIGFSEACCNFIGYIMHLNPAPTLFVQPTAEMVDLLSKTRIDTLIAACPELSARVAAPKSRDGKNTINLKTFPGGVLRLAGANSSAGLASMPVRNLILDEVDRYPLDVNYEGNPIDLAIARTSTFEHKKKILIGSTPTVAGLSSIEREFYGTEDDGKIIGGTDQNYFHVPCPHCGEKQKLVFSQLQWEENKPETAQYCCIHCGALIEERYKVQMFAKGEWIPDYPENSNSDVIGFHLNSLYSPYGWKSWKTIAGEFLEAKNSQEKLKVFVNTVLGEVWTERGDAPEYKNIYNRRENYRLNEIPDDVCFLTAGVDVQKDRIEVEVVGWCKDKRSYSIDYRVIEGDTAKDYVWNRLADMLDERWKRQHTEMAIQLMAVDSGYNTSYVYNFCKRFPRNRVIPIKGQDKLGLIFSAPKSTEVTKSGKKIGKVGVYSIGVSFLKSEFYGWLRLEKDESGTPPPCYCHFPQYDEHYFRGITAEENVRTVTKKGYITYEWRKKYERNEPLDCRIYARAAASIVGLDRLKPETLEAITGKVTKKSREPKSSDNNHGDMDNIRYIPQEEQNTPQRKRRRSSFWD